MLAVTRRSAIMEILQEDQSINVTELANRFGVAKETIRRDIKQLEAAGMLTRTHGGAYITEGVLNDINVSMRSVIYKEEKQIIARKCSDLIKTGDFLFLDESTTDWFLAQQLVEKHVTVLTNSLKVADILSGSSAVRLIVAGGNYAPKTMSFFGEQTIEDLSRYYVDKAFISCRTVSLEYGATDSNESAALVRRTMLRRSHSAYLVVDHTKLDSISYLTICTLDAVKAVICDRPLPLEWCGHLDSINVAHP